MFHHRGTHGHKGNGGGVSPGKAKKEGAPKCSRSKGPLSILNRKTITKPLQPARPAMRVQQQVQGRRQAGVCRKSQAAGQEVCTQHGKEGKQRSRKREGSRGYTGTKQRGRQNRHGKAAYAVWCSSKKRERGRQRTQRKAVEGRKEGTGIQAQAVRQLALCTAYGETMSPV